MKEIEVIVNDKIAKHVGCGFYVCDNSDFSVVFSFDEAWSAYNTKTARFKYNNLYQDVVFSGNICPIPIISGTNAVEVGVYAGDLHTTTGAVIAARKSILDGKNTHDDPPEDVYNQLMDAINNAVSDEKIQEAVDRYMDENQLEVYTPGDNIRIEDGVISVLTTNDAEADNTRPMTSAGVYTQIGNINVLLETI